MFCQFLAKNVSDNKEERLTIQPKYNPWQYLQKQDRYWINNLYALIQINYLTYKTILVVELKGYTVEE